MFKFNVSEGYEERHMPLRQPPPAQKPQPKDEED